MQMIWHQAINRTNQIFPGGGVKHQILETLVERGCQPAFGLVKNRQRPEHHGVGLIMLAGQTWQGERAIERIAGGFDWAVGIYFLEIRDSSRRLLQTIL